MRPIVDTVGPLSAAVANSIALNQTPAAGAAFTLNGSLASGGTAKIVPASQVSLTFAANETGHNFVIIGLDQGGNPVSEVVAGTTAGTVVSALTYGTVQSVVSASAASGNISTGNAQSGTGQWMRLDEWALPNISIGIDVTGTVNYTVQHSFDDPNSPTSPVAIGAMHWMNCPDLIAVAATTDAYTFYPFTPIFLRLLMNSGSGTATMTAVQSSVTPR